MELEVAKQLIKEYTAGHTEFIANSMIAERYYRNKTDILFKKPTDEKEENPLRNADNRIPSDFYGLLINQKASYMFTYPPLFDIGNSSNNKHITYILSDKYSKVCKDLCINASNSGIAWLHYWIDEKNDFQYGVVDSKQIIPIWSLDLNRELMAVLRCYKRILDDGKLYIIYEIWNKKECEAFCREESLTIDEALRPYEVFTYNSYVKMESSESSLFKHNFSEVPFIPFENNNIDMGDLNKIKALIDTYDKVYSGFVNDLEDIQEIIFILTGYSGTDLNSFLQELKKYKTVKIDADETNSGLSTLSIDIPVEAREKLLNMTRKAIFEQGQGVDPQVEKFGDASGVALKFLYSLLELKAGLMETEFRLSFGTFVRVICKYLNIECKTIIQTWTRNAIMNDSEQAAICSSSVGLVSNKTILKSHPLVDDADAEEKQFEKEKEQQQSEMDTYKETFKDAVNTKDGDVTDGEKE